MHHTKSNNNTDKTWSYHALWQSSWLKQQNKKMRWCSQNQSERWGSGHLQSQKVALWNTPHKIQIMS